MNFPIHNLDLSKYVKSKTASEGAHVYELFAISNHYGSLGGGHYSAYCKVFTLSPFVLELIIYMFIHLFLIGEVVCCT